MNPRAGFPGGGRGGRGGGSIGGAGGGGPVHGWVYTQPGPAWPPGEPADINRLRWIRCARKECNHQWPFERETDWRRHKQTCRSANSLFHCSFCACEDGSLTFESAEAAAQHENIVHRLWVCTVANCDFAFLVRRQAVVHVLMAHDQIPESAAVTAVRHTWTPKIPQGDGRMQLDRRLRFNLDHPFEEEGSQGSGLLSSLDTPRRSSRVQTSPGEADNAGLQDSILQHVYGQLEGINKLLLEQSLHLGTEGAKGLVEKLVSVGRTLEQRNPEATPHPGGQNLISWNPTFTEHGGSLRPPPTPSVARTGTAASSVVSPSRRPSHSSAGDLAEASFGTRIDVRGSTQPVNVVNVNMAEGYADTHPGETSPTSSTASSDHEWFLQRPPGINDPTREPMQPTHLPPSDQLEYFEKMQVFCVEAAFDFYRRHKSHLDSVTDRRGRPLCVTNVQSGVISSAKDLSLPQWTHLLRRLSDAKGLTRDMVSRIESFNGEIQPVDEVRHACTKKKTKSDRDLLALVQMTRIFTWQLKDWMRCGLLDELYTTLEMRIKTIRKDMRDMEGFTTAGRKRRGKGTGGRSAVVAVNTWPRNVNDADRTRPRNVSETDRA